MCDEALILSVLKRGIFGDIARVCAYYGLAEVEHQASSYEKSVIEERSLTRMIGNIKKAFARAQIQPPDSLSKPPTTKPDRRSIDPESPFARTAYAIHQRVCLRDLADLKAFLENGKTIGDIFEAGRAVSPACSDEYAKCVLIGDVPLDKEDLASATMTANAEGIFAFFRGSVDELEQKTAQEVYVEFFLFSG